MYTARFLIQPLIRASSTSIKAFPHSSLFHTHLLRGSEALQTWLNVLKLKVNRAVPNPYWNLIAHKYHGFPSTIFRNSGGKYAVNTILGLSVLLGATRPWPFITYCSDGFEFFPDDHDFTVSDYLDEDEDHRALVTALRKFLVPVFLLVTILVNWGQPFVIAAKVILILYGTKPSPFSVYLLVEQLRQQAIRQQPVVYKYLRPCYAKKVQVKDCMFLCFARVELNDQNLTLVGILGSWWVLRLSPWLEALPTLRNNFVDT